MLVALDQKEVGSFLEFLGCWRKSILDLILSNCWSNPRMGWNMKPWKIGSSKASSQQRIYIIGTHSISCDRPWSSIINWFTLTLWLLVPEVSFSYGDIAKTLTVLLFKRHSSLKYFKESPEGCHKRILGFSSYFTLDSLTKHYVSIASALVFLSNVQLLSLWGSSWTTKMKP